MKDCGDMKIQPLKGIKKTHTKQPEAEHLPKLPARWLFLWSIWVWQDPDTSAPDSKQVFVKGVLGLHYPNGADDQNR